MTQPVDPPTPPAPPPVTPGQKWYTSYAYLSWIGQQLVALGVLVGTLIGHPFDSSVITAAVSTAAMVVSGMTTVIFVHGQNQLAVRRLEHTQYLEYAHYAAKLEAAGFRQEGALVRG